MRNLNRLSIYVILLFATPIAFANDKPCYREIENTAHLHGEVECLSSKTIDDFSMYAAAHFYRNTPHKYRELVVKNGDNHVRVAAGRYIIDTGIGIGPFSFDFKRHTRSHITITSHAVRGSVSGKPWNEYPISNAAAKAKCDMIPAEEKKAESEKKGSEEGERQSAGTPRAPLKITAAERQSHLQSLLRDMIFAEIFKD